MTAPIRRDAPVINAVLLLRSLAVESLTFFASFVYHAGLNILNDNNRLEYIIKISTSIKDLPAPSSVEIQHSARLVSLIREQIEASGGVIGFDQYMNMALYEPGLGYYSAGLQKFGASGDFVTAPEVSPLFAQCLVRQVQQVLMTMESGSVLEFGAGSGRLMCDLLAELEHLDALPEQYLVIELSADLQQRQQQLAQEKIPHLASRIQWLNSLPTEKINAVVIANEVLDAMPVRIFEKQADGVIEWGVGIDDDQLQWQAKDADDDLNNSVNDIEARLHYALSPGYRSELNPAVQGWLQSVGDVLNQGLVLLIDYGYAASEYYSPERSMGTLMCYYRHHGHDDPFYYPGLQDMTAFVDFTAVAEAALDTGFDVMGYTSQAQFLFACGLPQLFEQQQSDDLQEQLHLSQQVKTLTLPSEMGERFKVMGLGKDIDPLLIGFMMADYRNRL